MAEKENKTIVVTVSVQVDKDGDENEIQKRIKDTIANGDGCSIANEVKVRKSYEKELIEELRSTCEELSTWVTEHAEKHDHTQIYINNAYKSAQDLLNKVE